MHQFSSAHITFTCVCQQGSYQLGLLIISHVPVGAICLLYDNCAVSAKLQDITPTAHVHIVCKVLDIPKGPLKVIPKYFLRSALLPLAKTVACMAQIL